MNKAVLRLAAIGVLAALAGCRSSRIDVAVENRTGAPVDLLEVDYPSASFGVDHLAAGAVYRYRLQVRGSGPVKVQYTAASTHRAWQLAGPALYEKQAGSLQILLLPAGQAEFHPVLHPGN